jgi:MscS family membrane protein
VVERVSVDPKVRRELSRALVYLVFLLAAYAALQRVPLHPRWAASIDGALFVVSVLIVSFLLVRLLGVVLAWYTVGVESGASELAAEFGPLASKVGSVFVTVVAAITILEHFQINVASLVVSLGVGSLAVGLAAQDTLSNMFAGFTLLLDRPFRIGERIRLSSGEVGDVQAIGIRATLIKTLEETILVVPNSLLVKERLVNLSRPARAIAASVEVAVEYGVDLERVRALLVAAAAGSTHVTPEPPPSALVQRFGEYAIHLSLGFHARDYAALGAARSEVHERAYAALRAAGIEIAQAPARASAISG